MPLNISYVSPYEIGDSGELLTPMGSFTAVNDANKRAWAIGNQSYDATPLSLLRMTTDLNSKIVLANDSMYGFECNITGGGSDDNGAFYKIFGGIKRIANAASTVLVGSLNKTSNENTAGWDATVVADTTLGAIDVQVTGAVGVQVNWTAEVMLWKVPNA